jgi:hypothetical protein
MPLIEVKDFPSTTHYLERLLQISTPDLIDTWEGNTPNEIFINRYKIALIKASAQLIFESNTGIAVEGILASYIYGLQKENNSIIKKFTFDEFFSSEILFFAQNGKSLYSIEQIIRLRTYFDFLNQNKNKIERIRRFPEIINLHVLNLVQRLHSYYNLDDLNLHQLDDQLFILFEKLDHCYELFERSFKDESEEKVWQKQEFLFIDWDYLKEPFQLEDDRAGMIMFINALKGYLKEALYQRKVFLEWHKTPKTYQIIEHFIEELKQESDKFKKAEQTITTAQDKRIDKAEDYPRSIFASQECYDFFCLLVHQATTSKQLSFIFRQMSEKENPVLIVVKDKAFRDWFNEQPFQMKAEEATSTHPNAKNEDRIWAYNTVKKLYFNES